MQTLTATETRVLGALIEKSITTPDNYPLTLNSLKSACNQKQNRDPVVAYQDADIARALESLRHKELARIATEAQVHTRRYEHRLKHVHHVSDAQMALLCELMIRGPQTTGELKTRTGRLDAGFATPADVEEALTKLEVREEADGGPLVVLMERQPGRKERRYAQLLSGEPKAETGVREVKPEAAALQVAAENERLEKLEADVAELKTVVARLEARLDD